MIVEFYRHPEYTGRTRKKYSYQLERFEENEGRLGQVLEGKMKEGGGRKVVSGYAGKTGEGRAIYLAAPV